MMRWRTSALMPTCCAHASHSEPSIPRAMVMPPEDDPVTPVMMFVVMIALIRGLSPTENPSSASLMMAKAGSAAMTQPYA